MRALIVENDPAVHAALESALAGIGDRENAPDRASALDRFEQSLADGRPFDLVIVDIETPGMQGDSIITAIRQKESDHQVSADKRVRIVVISASSARQVRTDCMFKGCDEFIGKPVDPDQFIELLARFNPSAAQSPAHDSLLTRMTGKELSDSVIKRIDRGDWELPPAPKIAIRTRQLVDTNADIEAMVDLLKHDLSISTKLIRMSNSVAYGGFEKNTAVSQAVRRLGIDRSVEVVMSICCRGYFVTNHPDYNQLVERLWWHSLACAHATNLVARRKKIRADEDLFALGLLHDIGKLILIQAASDLQLPKKRGMDIAPEALQSMLAEFHRPIGIRILKKWGYSKAFTASIQHHRVSVEANPPPAMQVLHEANLLVNAGGFGYDTQNDAETLQALEQLGYRTALQDEIKKEIHSQVEQLRYMFG